MSVSEQHDNRRVSGPAPHHGGAPSAGIDAGVRTANGERVCSGRTHASLTAPGNVDAPWDEASAEALMQVCEAAEAELVAFPAPTHRAEPCRHARACSGTEAESSEVGALEQRIAAFAGMLEQWLAQIDPAKSLAGFHQRLAEFERRLAAAVANLGHCGDASALAVIEAQITDLNAQLVATRKDLDRLETIDGQLNALARLMEGRQGSPSATDNLAQTAAEAAVRRLTFEPGQRQPGSAEGQQIIASLEQLLQRFVVERHADEQASIRALRGIEEALARILARIASLEHAAMPLEQDDSDGLAAESDRLAQAYAAGARALGQQPFTLAAADYSAAEAPCEEATAGPAQTSEAAATRRWGAKPQIATAPAAASGPEPEGTIEAGAQTCASSAREGLAGERRRWKGILPLAMTVLFSGGYIGVETLLADSVEPRVAMEASPGSGAQRQLVLPQPSPDRRPEPANALASATDPLARAPTSAAGRDAQQLAPDDAAHAIGEALAHEAQTIGAPDLPDGIGSSALRRAAVSGDPAAQFEVAARFAEGRGVLEDQAQAVAWLQRAALGGHGQAQLQLGLRYEHGSGTAVDVAQAKAWYQRAAEQGVIRAMHNLAVVTIGDGREADYAAAAHWFREAAERGLADSQFNLAVLYENGLGVTRDLAAAHRWYALAARNGSAAATDRLQQLKSVPSPDPLPAAERQTTDGRVTAE